MIKIATGIHGIGVELTSCLRNTDFIKKIIESKQGHIIRFQLELEEIKMKRDDVLKWLEERSLITDEALNIIKHFGIKTFYIDPESLKVKRA